MANEKDLLDPIFLKDLNADMTVTVIQDCPTGGLVSKPRTEMYGTRQEIEQAVFDGHTGVYGHLKSRLLRKIEQLPKVPDDIIGDELSDLTVLFDALAHRVGYLQQTTI